MTTNNKNFPFLSLPRELRDTVYHFALSLPENRITDVAGYTSYHINTKWLLLNKQIYHEALQVFRRNIFISISTPWQQAYQHVGSQGFVPLLAVDQAGENFKSYHLDVQISSPTISEAHLPLERFIILLDDLKTFCDFWFYQDLGYPGLNTHLKLTLVLKDPHSPAWENRTIPKILQRKLLEPFGAIRGIQEVKVVGQVYDSIESAMRKRMDEPLKSPEECLAEGTRLKEEGNVLLQKKQYRAAIKKYEEAFFAIHILVIGRRRSVWADAYFHAELRDGPDKGQFGHVIRIMLRFKLVANVIHAYIQLEEYEEAYFWGMRTIGLMGDASPDEPLDFPSGKEIGKIYYRTAKACKALDRKRDALKYFRIALMYLPGDQKVIETEISSLI